MDSSEIPMSEVSALCKALRVNNSLKMLDLLGVRCTEQESEALARQLLEDGCYDRVQPGPWTESYLRILSPVLASPEAGTKELRLSDIGCLSKETASLLFKALASNKKINSMTVYVSQHEPDDRKLVEIADLSDEEAQLGVAAAEMRRREKYLMLAGIVRRSVVCWPADTTQIDALNADCWCAIARYLKVSDICAA
ncbi:hypothetical protein MTO96_040950 [Rhipicephalus appendiculatus]